MIDCPGYAGMRERYVSNRMAAVPAAQNLSHCIALAEGASFFFPSSRSERCTTSSFAAALSSMVPASLRSPAIWTPGWVDVHTHYDGQAMWDPLLGPSCWHGVTTAMFGNCGVGFAPVRPQHRAALMELMEGVEEIPGVVLTDGLTWEWETFPDFLNALERRPRAIDIGAQLAHHPLRVYVMGDRAIRLEAANAEDIAQMRHLTIEALRAGAFGFTTSRTDSHKTPIGEMVPSRYAG